jgi:hypothetical protein
MLYLNTRKKKFWLSISQYLPECSVTQGIGLQLFSSWSGPVQGKLLVEQSPRRSWNPVQQSWEQLLQSNYSAQIPAIIIFKGLAKNFVVMDNVSTSIQNFAGLKLTKFPLTAFFGEIDLSYFESHFTQFVPNVAEVLLDVDVIVVKVVLDAVMEVAVVVTKIVVVVAEVAVFDAEADFVVVNEVVPRADCDVEWWIDAGVSIKWVEVVFCVYVVVAFVVVAFVIVVVADVFEIDSDVVTGVKSDVFAEGHVFVLNTVIVVVITVVVVVVSVEVDLDVVSWVKSDVAAKGISVVVGFVAAKLLFEVVVVVVVAVFVVVVVLVVVAVVLVVVVVDAVTVVVNVFLFKVIFRPVYFGFLTTKDLKFFLLNRLIWKSNEC